MHKIIKWNLKEVKQNHKRSNIPKLNVYQAKQSYLLIRDVGTNKYKYSCYTSWSTYQGCINAHERGKHIVAKKKNESAENYAQKVNIQKLFTVKKV